LCFRVVGSCTCHVGLAGERVESPSVDNLLWICMLCTLSRPSRGACRKSFGG
jgi:hypothetical protein